MCSARPLDLTITESGVPGFLVRLCSTGRSAARERRLFSWRDRQGTECHDLKEKLVNLSGRYGHNNPQNSEKECTPEVWR
jgi:hypothetical protein